MNAISKQSEPSIKRWIAIWSLGAIVVLALLWWGFQKLVGPPLPKSVTFAAGTSTGVYRTVAEKYREALLEDGIDLKVLETAGSAENLELLRSGEATVAILQGGTAEPIDREHMTSLASLYLEPVWLFYRADLGEVDEISDLKGHRIAVGPAGSGTHTIAAEWLSENGIEELAEDATESADGTSFLSVTGRAAAEKLQADEIDAAFIVVGAESEVIWDLVNDPSIRLMDFRRGDAYQTRFRYLKQVTFAEGMLDLRSNLPDQDIRMLATTANLVANEDLHPALVQLFLEAAKDVHESGGFFEQPQQFPSPFGVDIPIDQGAQRYFRDGPSFLYRFLPFRIANWLDRMKILLAPMLVLLVPLVKFFPPIYRYRIRRGIYRWYKVLREIDQKLQEDSYHDFSEDIKRLESLETELAEVSVPLSYMEEFYNLRIHVNYVLGLLSDRYKQPDHHVSLEEKIIHGDD